ncbi:MAG TPA: carboxypeptidase regulatory-like domain-containing protein [Candidatus Bathyarchaeia archaeon]|nr:carboxypeptidase regulatory-like domain-containing protein [Candidatus Bathyarchaeia archaeon]
MVINKTELLAFGLVFIALVPVPLGIFYLDQNVFGEQREIRIATRQWEFIPNEIIVKKDDMITLFVTSEDVIHGFQMMDYGIRAEIKPGEPQRFSFVADKAGEFFYRCFIPCGVGHSTIAHSGKFKVEDKSPPGSLRVYVTSVDGIFLEGASVTITGPKKAEGITNTDGQYVFSDLTAGDYSVKAVASGYGTNSTTAMVRGEAATTVTVVLTAAAVKVFNIEAWTQEKGGFKVAESEDGKTIIVNQGDIVRLIVKSMDVAHSLALHDFDVDTDYIEKGETITLEFTAIVAGTFTYDCMVYCSPQHSNMKGTLVVNSA